ncbi:hypothetical protein [Bartonella sp. DGB2]|uniref:hypothetical protein n=1 Tax=Bartonella sp. DGB2 TaxID=3388426 RepID=UPI00398F9739
MANSIGIYVHHHGDGHLQRALAIAHQAPDCFTLLGSGLRGRTGTIACVDLPDDGPSHGPAQMPTSLHPALHYAPVYHEAVRKRNQLIVSWIEATKPLLLLVDVSVEIAVLAQLCATPFVYTRLSGRRDDKAHHYIFKAAEALFCPFHVALDSPQTPHWVRAKTKYFAGLSKAPPPQKCQEKNLVFVVGRGGHTIAPTQWLELAKQLDDWQIDVLGPVHPQRGGPNNLTFHGWVNDPTAYMARAQVVAGPCGDGLLSDVCALGKPFIALPQRRPYEEQLDKARQLAARGAAVVCEVWPQVWRHVVSRALQLGNVLSCFYDDRAAHEAADYLLYLAHHRSVATGWTKQGVAYVY